MIPAGTPQFKIKNSKLKIQKTMFHTLPPAAAPIPLSEIIAALPACFRSTPPEKTKFAREIEAEYGIRHCFLVSSGKAALTTILRALKEKYPDRDQVLIPAYTCYSVPAAIKRAGLKIKLCDLAPESLDFDLDHLKSIIEADKKEAGNILCVLVTHLFGCPAAFDAIKAIVGPDIPLIEDAAQAMGEEYKGKKLGTLGGVGFYSLGRGKALSSMEGGMIVTDNHDLAEKINTLITALPTYFLPDRIKLAVKTLLATVLQHPSLFWLPKSLPFLRLGKTIYEPDFPIKKISCFQIKLAKNWKARLEHHRQARLKNIKFWQENLPLGMTCLCHSENSAMIRMPVLARDKNHRDQVVEKSEKSGLGIMAMYPTTVDKIPEISVEFKSQHYPHAQSVCDRLLTIPVHELVNKTDNSSIMSTLEKI